jgi:hypothetical protein
MIFHANLILFTIVFIFSDLNHKYIYKKINTQLFDKIGDFKKYLMLK